MRNSRVAKKVISDKVLAFATKTFESLGKSKPTPKAAKQISRSAKKLVKTIHALIRKSEKKRAKQAKVLAKRKAKAVVKARTGVQKPSKSAKPSIKLKKVPAN